MVNKGLLSVLWRAGGSTAEGRSLGGKLFLGTLQVADMPLPETDEDLEQLGSDLDSDSDYSDASLNGDRVRRGSEE